MNLPDAALQIIREAEGYRPEPHLCPAGVWTIGYGHAIREPETGGQLRGLENEARACALSDPPWDLARAETQLQQDLAPVLREIDALVLVPLTPNQRGALASLAYNIGIGHFRISTLLRRLNEQDYATAANEFLKWRYARGQALKGLETRRLAERALFLTA